MPVVVHDGFVDRHFYQLYGLHIVLYIVADVNQLLVFLLHALPESSQLGLECGAMVEHSVVGHILLYFEHVLYLLEVVGDFVEEGVEVLL